MCDRLKEDMLYIQSFYQIKKKVGKGYGETCQKKVIGNNVLINYSQCL